MTGKILMLCLLALLSSGCASTFIPVSWGIGTKAKDLSRSDLTLAILFDHYDPQRQTLRVAGESYNQVMMPSEVKHHLGAYRRDTKMIYRNIYQTFSDDQLRDLLVHEMSHHIWHSYMTPGQRLKWGEHLDQNPTPVRDMVRRIYPNPDEHDSEDFAFTVEYPRPVDIKCLAELNLITLPERDKILAQLKPPRPAVAQPEKAPQAPAAAQAGAVPEVHSTNTQQGSNAPSIPVSGNLSQGFSPVLPSGNVAQGAAAAIQPPGAPTDGAAQASSAPVLLPGTPAPQGLVGVPPQGSAPLAAVQPETDDDGPF